MRLNAFDPVPGRTVELYAGDLFDQGLDVDLLVISAWIDYYQPDPGSMIAVLLDSCGLKVGALPRALDLSKSPSIRAWVTPDLDNLPEPPCWPEGSKTRFRRLAVVESPRLKAEGDGERPVFQQMFCLLALLPLHGIDCRTVATPLLNTGRQKAEPHQLYPALIRAVRGGFRHVPDLERLVIFDLKHGPLRELGREIDTVLHRPDVQTRELKLNPEQRPQLKPLISSLRKFQPHRDIAEHNAIQAELKQILEELEGDAVTPVTLGVSARRLLEGLVAVRLGSRGRGLKLYRGIQMLSAEISAWTLSALHTVRVFGNWMAHADTDQEQQEKIPRRAVSHDDLYAMLFALQRVVQDYPWRIQANTARPVKRVNTLPRPPARP